jgi:pimeloyl-ACP methyl ester carboxylesterase
MIQRRVPKRPSPADLLKQSPWTLKDDVVERSLLNEENSNDLDILLGEAGHEELRRLAREAAAARRRGGPKVLILPGIMGSKLGVRGSFLGIQHDSVYWLNPIRFSLGVAKQLVLADNGSPGSILPVGAFLSTYLKIKLSLIIAGYDADFFPYDWRLSIDQSAKRLRDEINRLDEDVSLVAHSMGGLVARAAMKSGAKVRRLVMLGTPNYGSFAPVQALRGVYSVVKKLAALDLTASGSDLASIFATFDGLCQMLPATSKYSAANLFDPAAWPKTAPKVLSQVLKRSADVQASLAPANGNFVLIAGYNQDTVVGAALNDTSNEFEYTMSPAGDGTVPLQFALLENTPTYYVEESHGSLPNNGTVIQAVKDVLLHGTTDALPDSLPATRGVATRRVSEQSLRAAQLLPTRGAENLRSVELRNIVCDVAAPLTPSTVAPTTAVPTQAAETTSAEKWESLTVSRRKQRRLEVRFVRGSITDVNARAYSLGLFQAVTPSGAAAYIDRQLDGIITEFTQRRMFNSNVGEVFVMPAARRQLRADMVVFVGLGTYDGFDDQVQQIVAENLLRTLLRTNVEEMATVLFGGASGANVGKVLENLLRGFIRALNDVDGDGNFRSITICEVDQDRYQQIRSEMFRLASTKLFESVEVSFTDSKTALPSTAATDLSSQDSATMEPRGPVSTPEPVYLMVRQEASDTDTVTIRTSMLSPSAKAATISETVVVKKAELDACLATIETNNFTFGRLQTFGKQWTNLVLPDSVRMMLPSARDRHLVIVHDAESSRLPWETLYFEKADWTPAIENGVSHRYLAANLSVAKFLENRRREKNLELLLIVDPTDTLQGAKKEAERVNKLFKSQPAVRITTIQGADGTRPRLLKEFSSGKYDVIHYAGHAEFDKQERSRSGIVCANNDILSGADLSRLSNLPGLVFFNACESARVRSLRGKAATGKKLDLETQKMAGVSFAEGFLRGGVANFVGTYWPVGDAAAELFAGTFYQAVLAGSPLGQAVLNARKALQNKKQLDWADYIHYGNNQFQVKFPQQ